MDRTWFDLATTYVETDLEQAVAVGREAVVLAAGIQSRRSLQYIADLQKRLAPRSNDPRVREFNALVAERVGS